ncbi:MAG: hypothetical protein LC623_03000 [Halobacteriales archaeon]|nr:hypothetical protein [Halobacteriales archaeon]
MKGLLTIALVAAFVLAGCAGKGDTTSTTGKASSSTTGAKTTTSAGTTGGATTTGSTTSSTTTTSSGPPQEKTHAATLTANVRNGTVPLNVTFTLSATNTDAQTTWTIAFGDNSSRNGTALPGSATHRYNATGTKTAQATVRFGDGKTATSSLSIAVLPAAATNVTLLNLTFSDTIPIPKPVGTGTICGAPGIDQDGCTANQVATLNDNGANGTFFVWYDVSVPAGAVSLFVEGGSQEAQDCTAVCVPDFNLYVYAPDGAATAVATDAAWESAVVETPATGTWSVAVVYVAGPPNGEATTHIVVR